MQHDVASLKLECLLSNSAPKIVALHLPPHSPLSPPLPTPTPPLPPLDVLNETTREAPKSAGYDGRGREHRKPVQ
ncbi:hypothetical protein N7537_006852 [Penicillium hordei]|uniref:Uncharacterized protein n=1 Tax=Penicillium hordei TaxID=40994 RepID=A0AAD6H2E2_9EURO|nr:uncharacterized protein N7537_006852 [Penicillium hordei]KAJ5603896.1 hypothetical protein N7537_006852 [Penicillium hordei]